MKAYFFRIIILMFVAQIGFSSSQFLTISDIHYGSQNRPGKGHDTDGVLLQLAMAKLTQLAVGVDFIINLGDLPSHNASADEKVGYEKFVFQSLYQANTTAKPMFYIPGNNDSLLGNYQPFSQNGRSPLSLAENWSGACAHCENLIINDEHMYDGGYYSSFVMPKNKEIMLIALNTTQFMDWTSLHHPRYPKQDEDALVQFRWLKQQLSQHRAKQLLIAMHEPPGTNSFRKSYWQTHYLKQFLDLLKDNQSNYQQITLLTAHSHMDEIRKITLNPRQNIYAFSTPSVSPLFYNNSAMKIFKLADDLSLENYATYYTQSANNWLNDHYYAINDVNSIFPQCKENTIASCLDTLNKDLICANIEAGKYHGAKSSEVDNSACTRIYQIN